MIHIQDRPPSAALAKGDLLFALPFLSPVVAFLALDHGGIACVFIEHACPLADALQDRDHRLPFLRQGVFHPRRDLVIGLALDQVIGNEELEGRGQNGVCDVAHLLADLTVPKRPQGSQHADDAGGPLPAKQFHAILQRTADVLFQLSLIHDGTSCAASIILSDPQEDKSLCNL